MLLKTVGTNVRNALNRSLMSDCILNASLRIAIMTLIMLSGDIERNPGPTQSNVQNCLSILNLNIRSIRNKLDYISTNLLDFDIICFTETHLTTNFTNIELEGYSVPFRKDFTAHSSGLLCYTSTQLTSKRLLDLESALVHSIWVEIKYAHERLLLCAVYRPPSTADAFWNNFNMCIEKALDICNKIIIVGDINEDQLNPSNNHLKDILLINDLSNVITQPTRVIDNSSILTDPIIVTQNFTILDSGVLDVPHNISDHKATYISIPFTNISPSIVTRKIWFYKRGDYNKMNDLIREFNWDVLNTHSTNEACILFTNTITEFMQQCVPSKEVTIRRSDKPWYDSVIRLYSRRRDRQKAKAITTKRTDDWAKYKHLRNKVNNLKTHAKEKFINNMENIVTEANKSNPKLHWKILKQCTKSNKQPEGIPPLKNVSNTTEETFYFKDEDKCNCLNDYFVSVSTTDQTINDKTTLPECTLKTNSTFVNLNITEYEILDTIGTLDTNKAVGEDKISHTVLKNTMKSISKPLTLLFNKSLNECNFPDLWKVATVVPIFKKGDTNLASNYRPICLLSCVGKLMERVVFKHLYNYLTVNELIYKLQSGFLRGHSTVYQLIDLYNQICQGLDEKKHTCMVFCDVSKAFDRVWIKGLLFKLKLNGINGNLLKWIESYLTNRRQRVAIGSSVSRTKSTNAGVPQGSVLGPLFFLIYINDIAEQLLSVCRIFADDTSLSCTSSDILYIESILNHDLEVVNKWSKQWLVEFNPNKTEAILFTTRKNRSHPSLIFSNIHLTYVEHHKHLGITFSHNAKWHDHIENICASACKILGMMRKVKFLLSRKTLNQIYISFLRPSLEYASVVWDGCAQYEKDRLERIQHEAARIVTGLTRSVSIHKLYTEIGWLSLSERRCYQKLIIAYKTNNGLVPDYISSIFPHSVGFNIQYNLRNSSDYTIRSMRTQLLANSFIPSCLSVWNSLSEDLRQAQSIAIFKRSLMSNYFKVEPTPLQYLEGNRKLSLLHARLRNCCSDLSFDKFLNKLAVDAKCLRCGNDKEDAEHFFMQCPLFAHERIQLFRATRVFHPLNPQTLLFGKATYSYEQNLQIFIAVQHYIKKTKRFE